jgi:hypothetical protein
MELKNLKRIHKFGLESKLHAIMIAHRLEMAPNFLLYQNPALQKKKPKNTGRH